MRNIIAVVTMSLLLAGCSLSMSEYNARVKWCLSQGAGVVARRDQYGQVYRVQCVKDGLLFNTPSLLH